MCVCVHVCTCVARKEPHPGRASGLSLSHAPALRSFSLRISLLPLYLPRVNIQAAQAGVLIALSFDTSSVRRDCQPWGGGGDTTEPLKSPQPGDSMSLAKRCHFEDCTACCPRGLYLIFSIDKTVTHLIHGLKSRFELMHSAKENPRLSYSYLWCEANLLFCLGGKRPSGQWK